jgi:PAS domain S-box-containing protein
MVARQRQKEEVVIPDADALFASLFDQSAAGVAILEVDGRFLRANPAFCRIVGYTEEELQQRTFLDLTYPEDYNITSTNREQLISGTAKSQTYEKRYVHKSGAPVWVQVVGTVIRDKVGKPLCTVAIVNDIGGLKRTQAALQESEERFRRMVEMSSDWYWVQDENFRFVELPGLAKRDLDPEMVIGKTRWEIPDLAPLLERVWEQHRARLERHEPFTNFIFLRKNKAGEMRYLSVTGEPIFDKDGKFRGYHGVGKDITDQARGQKALEESEERYRTLFEVHPNPMWVVDAKTLSFLAVNDEAVRLYGYTREEFLSMTADQIRPEEDIAELIKAFQDRSRTYKQRIWRHKKKSGELMYVEIVSFNLEFDGKMARLGVINDITERIKVEERAQEIEKRYQDLLAERRGTGAR